MHLYLLQKSSGIITAAVYGNFFAPKQHALDGGTLEGSSLVGGTLDGGVRSALDGGALDGGAAALDGGALDGGALDGGTLDGGVRFFGTLGGDTLTFDCSRETCSRSIVWSTAARSARHAHDDGALDGGALDGGTLNGGTLEPRRRHCCRRKEFFSCFTELLQITVVTRRCRDHTPRRRRVTFAFPVGGRQLCTSRIIHFRVASPAVTSVGTFQTEPCR